MYIGLDLGTSGLKALLIDQNQSIVGMASAPLQVSRPQHGWSEQDPADWINAAKASLNSLRQTHPSEYSAVTGIGLSGQQHGATLLAADDKVLRPCILWNDSRAALEAQEMTASPAFARITQNTIFAGFTAPKLRWISRHEPAIFDRVRKILLPKDYLRLWLIGDSVSDMSDASGMGWLDIANRRWSSELLDETQLNLTAMPRLAEGTEVTGTLRADLAAELGLSKQIVVAGGAGDNAAAACGMGAIKENVAFASFGTSGVLFAATDQFRPNRQSAVHSFCHAVPDTWHQMGVILSATDSLNWLAAMTREQPAQLTGALGETLRKPSRVTFLPYLSGERTPHNDASARGALIGIDHNVDSTELTQAVVEAISFALKDNLTALAEAGTQIDRVWAIGGGSRSLYWLKVTATVLGIPVDVPAAGDFGAAFGAARLGLIAAEGADPAQICQPPAVAQSIAPDNQLGPAYAAAYERFRRLYPAIKSIDSAG